MSRRAVSPAVALLKQVLALLLLPLRAPLLLVLFGVAIYLGLHWSLSDSHTSLDGAAQGAAQNTLFWSIDCLHAVLVVFICTMPEQLLQRVSALMAASRVVSLVVTLLIVTVGGLYLLHLNVLSNVLILASAVLLARLDLLRLRLTPPPLLMALCLSLVVLLGAAVGRTIGVPAA
ncbi:MAG: hypothetical protein RLZZ336_306 [Cyanobacteriota bacterium]